MTGSIAVSGGLKFHPDGSIYGKQPRPNSSNKTKATQRADVGAPGASKLRRLGCSELRTAKQVPKNRQQRMTV